MKLKLVVFSIIAALMLSCTGILSVAANEHIYRNVAYFTSWSGYQRAVKVGDINPSLLTHINFAFADLSADGEIIVGDPWIDTQKPYGDDTWETELKGHFGQLIKLKQQHPDIKTLISVGGWTWSKNFSDVAASDTLRKSCARSAVEFVVKYGFDGVDLDWEYPVQGGDNIPHRANDGDNYILLLKELRTALDAQGEKDSKEYVLSIAGASDANFIANCKVAEMMKFLDYINVMTYDYHGTWDKETNHNTPLYADSGNPSVASTIENYIAAGVKPADLNLGLAFSGKGWINVTDPDGSGLYKSGTAPSSAGYGNGTFEAAVFDFWDIAENYVGKNNYVRYWDDVAKVPYLYNGSTFITYEDEESIGYKADYVKKMELGGTMFWEFSYDKNSVLQKVVAKSLNINKIPDTVLYYGDVNEDGALDAIDFALLKSFILGKGTLQNMAIADVNNDGSVDALDITNLKMILLGKADPKTY